MSSNLKVNTILPSTGTSIGIGTAGGDTTISGAASVDTNLTLGGDIIHSGDDTKIRFPSNDLITFETAGTERLRIESGGDVDIKGGVIKLASGANRRLMYRSGDNDVILEGASNFFYQQKIADTSHRWYTNGADEKLTITGAGNIGIGTNNPADILDISSDSASGVSNMYLRNHANLGGAALNIWTQGTYASPTYKAIIGCSDAGGNIRMGSSSNHDLLLLTNNTPRVTITTDGHTLFSGLSTKNDPRNTNGITLKSTAGVSFQNFGANGSRNWRIRPDDQSRWGDLDFSVSPTANSATDWPDAAEDKVLTLGYDGQVSKPRQASFHVTIGGGQINSNVGVIVFTDTTSHINHNTGSHYNTSNGRFTAPIAGKYLITARMLTNSSSQSYTIYIIRRNGTSLGYIGHNHSDYWLMESGTFVMDLNANDYIDCYLQQHSGHGGYGYASFSGYLLG